VHHFLHDLNLSASLAALLLLQHRLLVGGGRRSSSLHFSEQLEKVLGGLHRIGYPQYGGLVESSHCLEGRLDARRVTGEVDEAISALSS
jgi:hypothetical protein